MRTNSTSRRFGSVEKQLHLEGDVVGAALLRARGVVVVDPLVLEGEVHQVERCHVVLQAARDPRLAGGNPRRRDLSQGEREIFANLPLLELAEDGEVAAMIV